MKKANKALAVFLAAGMAVTLFSACSNNAAPPAQSAPAASAPAASTPGATAPAVDPYGPVSDKTTVMHIGREESSNVTYAPGEDSHNNYIVKYLSEKLNVEYVYDFSVDQASFNTKVSMAIASGEMPDVMNVNYLQMRQLIEAGAIEDMTDVYNTYASDKLKRAFDSTQGISFDLVNEGGRMMAMPNISPGMDSIPMLYVRGDWMEECGLTEAPKTMEDVSKIVKTFKEKNPGGKVNTGIVASSDIIQEGGGSYHIDSLFGMHNAFPGYWLEQADGTTQYGSVTPAAKTALTEIRKLVVDGVLDPSFAVRDGNQCREILFSGQGGVMFGSWWNGQALVSMLEAADDSVFFNIYPAPLDSNGKLNAHMKSPSDSFVVVKKGCSEELKQAVVKTINYQYDLDQDQAMDVRPDGMDSPFSWHYYPINVLHCDYDAKELQIQSVRDVMDGKLTYEELSGDGKTWYNGYTTVLEKGFRAAADTNISLANAWGWSTGAWAVQSNNDKINHVYGATYAKTPTMESKWATLQTMEDEIYLQILTGDASIDAFDKFVEQWKALGGDTITKEINEIVAAQK